MKTYFILYILPIYPSKCTYWTFNMEWVCVFLFILSAFACQTLGKKLSSSVQALHIKRIKFSSRTLVKSLFGILGQTLASSHCVHAYSGTVPMALKSPGRGTWEDPPHSLQSSAPRFCWIETDSVLFYGWWYFDNWTAYVIDPHSMFSCFTSPFLWFPLSLTLHECFSQTEVLMEQ